MEIQNHTWSMEDHDGVNLASRTQIPLKLAWVRSLIGLYAMHLLAQAITIHKSQGMSIDLLEVKIDDVFDNGQASSPIHLESNTSSRLTSHCRVLLACLVCACLRSTQDDSRPTPRQARLLF